MEKVTRISRTLWQKLKEKSITLMISISWWNEDVNDAQELERTRLKVEQRPLV